MADLLSGNLLQPQQNSFSLSGMQQGANPSGITFGADGAIQMPELQNISTNLKEFGSVDPSLNNSLAQGGGGGFFTQGNSTLGNIGEGLGVAGGIASLASVLDNWGVAKDAMKLNMANVRQQMGNNQEAFDRSKGRQDRSLAAVNSANDRAQAIQGQQPQQIGTGG